MQRYEEKRNGPVPPPFEVEGAATGDAASAPTDIDWINQFVDVLPPQSQLFPPSHGSVGGGDLEDDVTSAGNEGDGNPVSASSIANLLRGCSIIVGMHPDEPTGAIVDCAVALGKPFAVVPCCVFPERFVNRRTCGHFTTPWMKNTACICDSNSVSAADDGDRGGGGASVAAGTGAEAATAASTANQCAVKCSSVRNHADLCEHLRRRPATCVSYFSKRGSKVKRVLGNVEDVGFDGRNTAVWGYGV